MDSLTKRKDELTKKIDAFAKRKFKYQKKI